MDMHRKKFLQLAAAAPLALLLHPLKGWAINDGRSFSSNENVIYFTKGDAEYETLRKGFNKRIDKYPKVIAKCLNEKGVAEAIRLAKKNHLPIAVKSSGHCMEGFSCNNDGMVINLSELNTIEWLDENTVRVGPACTLSKLYDALLPKHKIIPGGSCAGVAIGGLTLGGGYGLLSRRFGLTCDSLESVNMVDGNGQVQIGTANSDLLWACKGGNNGNFGVVTSLTFRVQQAPATMQSFKFRSYKLNTLRARKIISQWFESTKILPPQAFSAFVLNRNTAYVLLTNTGEMTASTQRFIAAMKSISDKSTNTSKMPLQSALKNYYGRQYPLYFKNASAGLYKGFSDIEGCIDGVIEQVFSTSGMIFQINTLGGNTQNATFESNAAFAHRAYGYFSELQTYWEQPSQQAKCLSSFQKVQTLIAKNGVTAQYRNYPDVLFSNWADAYYGKNHNKLLGIKKKYDPDNVFRFEQSL